MQQPLPTGAPRTVAPSFYLAERQFLGPEAILLAIIAAVSLLSLVSYSLGHTKQVQLSVGNSGAGRTPMDPTGAAQTADDNDDSSQVDTVYLGDLADAPLPTRPRDHVSTVHPFIVVHLPRFGNQFGLLPDTPAGHLLFSWLAAFNHADGPALLRVLPMDALSSATAEQVELRKKTGGFTVVSATEIRPGVLVFRLRDQTSAAAEVLGTLQARPNASPAAMATFSLRAVSAPGQDADATNAALLVGLPVRR